MVVKVCTGLLILLGRICCAFENSRVDMVCDICVNDIMVLFVWQKGVESMIEVCDVCQVVGTMIFLVEVGLVGVGLVWIH